MCLKFSTYTCSICMCVCVQLYVHVSVRVRMRVCGILRLREVLQVVGWKLYLKVLHNNCFKNVFSKCMHLHRNMIDYFKPRNVHGSIFVWLCLCRNAHGCTYISYSCLVAKFVSGTIFELLVHPSLLNTCAHLYSRTHAYTYTRMHTHACTHTHAHTTYSMSLSI